MHICRPWVLLVASLLLVAPTAARATPRINLEVSLHPERSLSAPLEVTATILTDAPVQELRFSLHHDLRLEQPDPAVATLGEHGRDGLAMHYSLHFRAPTRVARLRYAGTISEPENSEGQSPGVISGTGSDAGASLLPESFWHPVLGTPFHYEVRLDLPAGWQGIVPGAPLDDSQRAYRSLAPSTELPLVAARFAVRETRMSDGTRVSVWLRANDNATDRSGGILSSEPPLSEADEALAAHFLKLVPSYIARYSALIGAFPYPSYTVVENQLETGYAFPAFTLLGSSVIRLPFIQRSSLPHEVLHSWWGNSVEVDYERGNWCEGLTTYLADRAFQIEDGQGPTYRRKTLQGFQDFVSAEHDFPVRRFVSKNDQGSQAVGYGKVMMIFGMLENHLGSEVFFRALSRFYRDYRFRMASFADLQGAFEQEAAHSLEAFFGPWLDQTGAPSVTLDDATFRDGRLRFTVTQTVPAGDRPYLLPIRAQLRMRDGSVRMLPVTLSSESARPASFEFTFEPGAEALRFDLDPGFEIFRRLYPEEMPLSFSKVFAEEREITISVPAPESAAYEAWVSALRVTLQRTPSGSPTASIRLITDTDPMPTSGALWILGARNRHALASSAAAAWTRHGVTHTEGRLDFGGKSWLGQNGAVFLTERIGTLPSLWVWTEPGLPAQVLLGKILHYSGFSIAGFTDAKNTLRAEWPVESSSLSRPF